MSTYPSLSSNNDPELLKIKTKVDEIKNLKYETENLKYQTEKYGHENTLKSLKIDNENYKKKRKSLNKKVFMIVSETLIGSDGLGVGSGLT